MLVSRALFRFSQSFSLVSASSVHCSRRRRLSLLTAYDYCSRFEIFLFFSFKSIFNNLFPFGRGFFLFIAETSTSRETTNRRKENRQPLLALLNVSKASKKHKPIAFDIFLKSCQRYYPLFRRSRIIFLLSMSSRFRSFEFKGGCIR